MKTLSAKDSWGNRDARSTVNHLSKLCSSILQLPPTTTHLPLGKKHSNRKPHPNELPHDTKDHFFKLKFICSRNRARTPGRTVETRRTGGEWWRLHMQTHTHLYKTHLVPVRPLDLFVWEPVVPSITPPSHTYTLIHNKSSLFKQQRYCDSSFIAFPQDLILYMLNSIKRSQSSFLNLKCHQRGNHPPQDEYCTKK